MTTATTHSAPREPFLVMQDLVRLHVAHQHTDAGSSRSASGSAS